MQLLCVFCLVLLWEVGAASLSEVKLHLDIEGHASHYTIPWTELMAKVPGLSPEALWREANVTEDLASMLNRYKLIYKTSGTLGIALAEPVDIPAVSEGSMQVDASKVHPGVISGLNSPACMLSAPLEKQLFYYIGTMLPNTRPHSYVFYQLRCHLSYVALSINGDKFQYTGAMTSKFLMGTYKRVTEKGDEHVLSLIFGKTKDLPDLRGPFSYPSLTSAQSGDYSLVIVTTFVHYANFHNYFVPNLKDMFSRAVTMTAASYARYVLQKLVLLEMKGGCREPELDTETLTTMFEVSVAFFKVGHAVGETGNGCVDLRWLAKSFFELTVLKDIIGICYGATVKGMQSYGLERLAAMLMATVKMEELGHLTTEKQEYALRLATVGYPKAGVYSGLIGGATSVLLSAYNRHPLFQPLHTVMRETLFIGSHVVLRELRLNVTTQGPNLALYQLLSTALCSALEIGEVLRGLALGTESGLFSPCYLSLRFDLTRDKLLSMAPQEATLDQAAISNAVDGFLGRLSLEREDRDAWHLPAYKCVDRLDKVLMIIPLINVTFIISSDREVRGSALYEASTTYLSSSLFLSPVIMNKCSQGAVAGEPRQIPKIQNFTRTQKSCIFCGFALLSYDEKEGLETTTYITSQEVQNSILSSNYFDFDNLHVHYLLLTTNGTVMEIAGLYEERAHVVLAIILYFIAFALGIFLVHKIVMFFL